MGIPIFILSIYSIILAVSLYLVIKRKDRFKPGKRWECIDSTSLCQGPKDTGYWTSLSGCQTDGNCKIPFLLGGWGPTTPVDIFGAYSSNKCFNFIEFYESGESVYAGNNLENYSDRIKDFRSKGGILLASREIVLEANRFECEKIFSNPEENPGVFVAKDGKEYNYGSQKEWSENIEKSGVPIDGIIFDYEVGAVQNSPKLVDCMNTLVRYYNDNPDIYCGERRIILFSLGEGFLNEGKPGSTEIVDKMFGMTTYPNITVYFEFQKYSVEGTSLPDIINSFSGFYGKILKNSTMVMYSGEFVKSNQDVQKSIKIAEQMGLRGISFLNEPPTGVDVSLLSRISC